MNIESIEMKNFRCFENLKVDLNKKYTVLLGINGVGKSTILDAISIGLGSYLSGFDNIPTNSIHTDDAHYKMYEMGSNIERQGQYPVDIFLKANIMGDDFTWKRSLNGEGRKTTIVEAKEIKAYAEELQQQVRNGDKNCILPIIAYYGTGRLWMQKRKKKTDNLKAKKTDINRTMGYLDCLDVASNEKLMIRWFEKMTYIQLQTGEPVAELEAVKRAMSNCFISSNENILDAKFSYNVNSGEIEIELKDSEGKKEKLPMKALSDGIKGTISMIADIAYRMAMLNPQLLSDVLTTPGIVLIDEIDMHLHPEWQKKIVDDLINIFPKVQFVLTTHSPSVVANVPKENILILDNHQVYEPQNMTYGRDVNSILREIMGTEVRPKKIKALIKNFYDAIDELDINQAKVYLEEMKAKLGKDDAEVVQAQVYLDVAEV